MTVTKRLVSHWEKYDALTDCTFRVPLDINAAADFRANMLPGHSYLRDVHVISSGSD